MANITHAGELELHGYIIPCYVTDKGVRVISSRRMQVALGVTPETTTSGGQVPGKRLDRFFNQKSLKPVFKDQKDSSIWTPIRLKWQGKTIVGYNAEILPEICEAMLTARREGLLKGKRQRIIAKQCEILLSGFARIGLIALIDEVTGFQDDRTKDALTKILEQYLAKELQKWVKTFPNEYYKEMFKLRGWPYNENSTKRAPLVGKITNDIVYDRLAPVVREELEKRNPRLPSGHRRHKQFQYLSTNFGHPRLREHLASVVTLMKVASTWRKFKEMLNRALPTYPKYPTLFDQIP